MVRNAASTSSWRGRFEIVCGRFTGSRACTFEVIEPFHPLLCACVPQVATGCWMRLQRKGSRQECPHKATALPPKANILGARWNVRQGRKANIANSYRVSMSGSFHVSNSGFSPVGVRLVLPILNLVHDCNLIPVSYKPIGSIVADARCRLLARCPLPHRRGFCPRAGKALD